MLLGEAGCFFGGLFGGEVVLFFYCFFLCRFNIFGGTRRYWNVDRGGLVQIKFLCDFLKWAQKETIMQGVVMSIDIPHVTGSTGTEVTGSYTTKDQDSC